VGHENAFDSYAHTFGDVLSAILESLTWILSKTAQLSKVSNTNHKTGGLEMRRTRLDHDYFKHTCGILTLSTLTWIWTEMHQFKIMMCSLMVEISKAHKN